MNDYVGRGKETFTYMYKECKHYNIPSGYRLKLIPASVIKLSETANFVHSSV